MDNCRASEEKKGVGNWRLPTLSRPGGSFGRWCLGDAQSDCYALNKKILGVKKYFFHS